jgi:hypothetical protein
VAKVATFRSYNSAPILVTLYELLVRAESEINQVQGWKKPGFFFKPRFFFKNPAQWVLYIYIFAKKREFLGFFSVSRILLGRAADPDSDSIGSVDPDPDPGGQK